MRNMSPDPHRCLKPWIILNATYTTLFPIIHPFHSNEALYGFSWAYPNCQRLYSCPLGPLLSTRVTGTQALWHCDTMTVNPMDDMTTKGLLGGERIQCRDAGPRDASGLRLDRLGQREISSRYSEWHTIQNLRLVFFLGISHWRFSDHNWL